MKKIYLLLSVVAIAYLFSVGCKKSSDTTTHPTNNNDTLSAFAKELALTCTHAFSAQGDSSVFALPTAYTPNGDGVNDVYRLDGMYQQFTTYLLTVYKTNGTKVFQTTTSTNSWQGTDTTGAKCTDYKYWVKIKYTTADKSVDTGTFVFLLSTNTAMGCVNRVAADTASYKFPDQFNGFTGAYSYSTNETFCN